MSCQRWRLTDRRVRERRSRGRAELGGRGRRPRLGVGRAGSAGRASRLRRSRPRRPRTRAADARVRRDLLRHRRLHRALHPQDLGRARRGTDLHALHAQLRRLPSRRHRLRSRAGGARGPSRGWCPLPERRGHGRSSHLERERGRRLLHLPSGDGGRSSHPTRCVRPADRSRLRHAHHRRLPDPREQDLSRVPDLRLHGADQAARTGPPGPTPSDWRGATSIRAGCRSTSPNPVVWRGSIRRRKRPISASPATSSRARRCGGCTRSSTGACSAGSATCTHRPCSTTAR